MDHSEAATNPNPIKDMMPIVTFLNDITMDPTFGGQTSLEPSSSPYKTKSDWGRLQPPDLFHPSGITYSTG
jgi:hypothetical protein